MCVVSTCCEPPYSQSCHEGNKGGRVSLTVGNAERGQRGRRYLLVGLEATPRCIA